MTLAAASAAVLLWAGRWFFAVPAPEPGARTSAPPTEVAATLRPAGEARPAAPQAAVATIVPPGVTPEQWAALEAELQASPDGPAERARLIAYFEWSDAVQRWRAARHDLALAQVVDAGLPDRLARREVSAAEARLLKAALLETLEPDAAQRAVALQAFDAGLPTVAAGPDARQRQFQQRQAALVAAWQTRPAAERDPAALARQLESLRRAHFAQNPASAPGR